jgi:hypothetical protein
MKTKEKVVYKGGRDPYRYNSKDYNEYITQRNWWMDNLNLKIICDYLEKLNYEVSSDKFILQNLIEFKNNIEDNKNK